MQTAVPCETATECSSTKIVPILLHAQVLERRQGLNFRVNMKSRGDTFGEVSLMYNVPRSATVAATHESTVWVLERDAFRCAATALEQ